MEHVATVWHSSQFVAFVVILQANCARRLFALPFQFLRLFGVVLDHLKRVYDSRRRPDLWSPTTMLFIELRKDPLHSQLSHVSSPKVSLDKGDDDANGQAYKENNRHR